MTSTFATHIPFVEMLGCELVAWDIGRAEIALTLRDELTNSREMAHGGVVMTLLDVAMAHAARSPDPTGEPEPRGVVTIEMKSTFMRPAVGRLRAQGTLVHRTHAMAFCEGRILDAGGAVVAQSTGTFKYVRPLAPAPKAPQPLDASR